MKDYLLCASLASGVISAVFWLISAFVKVKPGPAVEDKNGLYPARIIINGADLQPTMLRQSLWNSRAAIAAAVTALLQVAYSAWPNAV